MLWAYARDLFQTPGFGDTVDFVQIKQHYYVVHTDLNPTQIVPKGPDRRGWLTPHGREQLGGRPFGDGTPPGPPLAGGGRPESHAARGLGPRLQRRARRGGQAQVTCRRRHSRRNATNGDVSLRSSDARRAMRSSLSEERTQRCKPSRNTQLLGFADRKAERRCAMNLAPSETEKLLMAVAGMVARDRLARGVKLNYPESVALLSTWVIERAREGGRVEDLMVAGREVLSRDDVMEGVAEMLTDVQVEATFPDGRKLVTLHQPIQ